MLLQMQVPTPQQPSHGMLATFAYQWLDPASVLIPRKLPAIAPCCLSGCQIATEGLNTLGQIDQDTFDAIHALCHSLGSRLWVGELATDDASAGKPAANKIEDCKRFCLAANEQRRKFSSKSCSLASPAGRSDWRRPVSTNSTSTPAAATATR